MEAFGSIKVWLSDSSSPVLLHQASSNNRNLLQIFFVSHTWQDKQAIDESSIMHGLTGTDSARPTVNMWRQYQISTLAARRCIYLVLGRTPNSTELQLPRLRGADNTCKRHHSQPLPAQIFSLLFTPSEWTGLRWNALAMSKNDAQPVHMIERCIFLFPSLDIFF